MGSAQNAQYMLGSEPAPATTLDRLHAARLRKASQSMSFVGTSGRGLK